MSATPGYAELNCLPNFSFQLGASQCEALVARAAALGYSALAINDEIRWTGWCGPIPRLKKSACNY